MPRQELEERWVCVHCNNSFAVKEDAEYCELGHEIIYIGFHIMEIKKFLEWLYTGVESDESRSFIDKVAKKDRLRTT